MIYFDWLEYKGQLFLLVKQHCGCLELAASPPLNLILSATTKFSSFALCDIICAKAVLPRRADLWGLDRAGTTRMKSVPVRLKVKDEVLQLSSPIPAHRVNVSCLLHNTVLFATQLSCLGHLCGSLIPHSTSSLSKDTQIIY